MEGFILFVVGLAVVVLLGVSSINNPEDRIYKIYGAKVPYHKATYLGGNPEFRESRSVGILVLLTDRLVFATDTYDKLTERFSVSFEHIAGLRWIRPSEPVVIWADEVPLAISWPLEMHGTVAIAFRNDLGQISVMSLKLADAKQTEAMVNEIAQHMHYASYDRQRQLDSTPRLGQ